MRRAMVGMLGEQHGSIAIEYGLIAAIIGTALIVLITDVGSGLLGLLNSIHSDFPGLPG